MNTKNTSKRNSSTKKNQQTKPKVKQTDVFTQEEAELQQAGLVSALPDEPWGKRKDRQSRSILITINNPQDSGTTRENVAEIMKRLKVTYWCFCEEIAPTGMRHFHVYFYRPSPFRFGTLKNAFPGANIQFCNAPPQVVRGYVTKENWEGTSKAETRVEGSFYEEGEIPAMREGGSGGTWETAQDMLRTGSSVDDVLNQFPQLIPRAKDLHQEAERLRTQEYAAKFRPELEVTILYGEPGTGKTRYVYDHHPIEDICRITDYDERGATKFDAYHGESVLFLDEYRNQLPISTMLTIADIYPLTLPARYYNRQAAYTKLYIATNLTPKALYATEDPSSRRAFWRRVTHLYEVQSGGKMVELKKEEVA